MSSLCQIDRADYAIFSDPGSEFPEKQIDMKTKNLKNQRSNGTELKMMLFIFLASFLGVALAVLFFSFIL